MGAKSESARETSKQFKHELLMTRTFHAPRELVFEVWTTPEHLSRWFGPRGFTLPVCEMDFRPGGIIRYTMRGPDGTDYPCGDGEYLAIEAGSRIVFRGNIDGIPGHEVLTTVTFEDDEDGTKVTVHQRFTFQSDATRGAPIGWSQTLDRLGEYLETQ